MENESKYADVPVRIKSWGVIIAIFTLALLHPLLTCVFVSALSLIGMREYFSMVSISTEKTGKILLLAYAMLPIEFYFTYTNDYPGFLFSWFIYCFIIVLYSLVLIPSYIDSSLKIKILLRRSKKLLLGVAINVFAIGHLAFIAYFNTSSQELLGIKLLILLVVATEWNDIFQYLCGKRFGRRKILPQISPNKTVEGLLGALFLTPILVNILGLILLPTLGLLLCTLLGLLISLLGFCGDIYISSVKRTAGVKDTGTLIPGHGGLLDRIDSLIFISPVYYFFILYYFQ